METEEAMELLGQAEAWKHILAYVDSMVLKCAVELGIPDIIHSHGQPITLSQIASSIDSPSPDISYLTRIMRLLVFGKIFTVDHPSGGGGEPLYGLTNASRWLLRDSTGSLAPMSLLMTNPLVISSWHLLGQCVKEGGYPFEKANGFSTWELASKNPELNQLFNTAMECGTRIMTRGILTGYQGGFDSVEGTLMDVGGGTGAFMSEIVKCHPHIKGVNFDLPHVVAAAPQYQGVSHIGGNMFEAIPKADAIIIKSVLHNWGDVDCVKILRNCHKSIKDGKTGKLFIIDIVLEPEGDDPLDSIRMVFDLFMMVHFPGAMERDRQQWKNILKEGGFPNYKIIKVPGLLSIIEAYPA